MNDCLRTGAFEALICTDPVEKVQLTKSLSSAGELINASLSFPDAVGRPCRPELVNPRKVPNRAVNTRDGRGMLLHALAHIEFNAINLALDLIVRFRDLPAEFYFDWLKVAKEEALHHELLCARLHDYGLSYGDYPAHDGLWQMAEKTKASLLARLGLVPRLLEARGLDVSPGIRAKLASVGDLQSAQVLDVILRDEIGHVEIGNRWFNYECQRLSLDPINAFESCLSEYAAPMPRSPFNYEAREQAGFSKAELAWLHQLEFEQSC